MASHITTERLDRCIAFKQASKAVARVPRWAGGVHMHSMNGRSACGDPSTQPICALSCGAAPRWQQALSCAATSSPVEFLVK